MDAQPRQRNQTIDILRLIAAFSIICLHNFSGSGVIGGEETVALTRFAVPLFSMFSGYFAAGFDRKRKLRQFSRILIWAVLSNLMYLAKELLPQRTAYAARMRLSQIFPPGSWKNLLLFNESPISAHLWFLGAFAYVLLLDLLLGWLFDKLPRWTRWCLTLALMLGGLTMYQLLTRDPGVDFQLYHYRNFLLFGLPFFLSGKLIRTGSFARIKKISWWGCLPLVFLAERLAVLEYGSLGPWELYIGSIVTAFALMLLALNYPLSNAPKAVRAISWLGRETTLTVYIVHIYFLDLLRGIYWQHMQWQYEFGIFHLIPLGVFALSLTAGAVLALGRAGVRKLLSKRAHA